MKWRGGINDSLFQIICSKHTSIHRHQKSCWRRCYTRRSRSCYVQTNTQLRSNTEMNEEGCSCCQLCHILRRRLPHRGCRGSSHSACTHSSAGTKRIPLLWRTSKVIWTSLCSNAQSYDMLPQILTWKKTSNSLSVFSDQTVLKS